MASMFRPRTPSTIPRCDLIRVGFSAEELATSAGTMRLFHAGQGPALLLLHGIGGGASSYYWSRMAPLLTPHFTVYAPDFVGWGDSEHPARFLLFDDYIAQVRAVVEAIGSEVVIVAQGLAAGFAIAALRAHPPLEVPRLVLLAPSGGRDFGVDAFDPLFAWTLSLLARCPGVNLALYRGFFHRRGAYRSWFTRRGFLDPRRVPEDLIEAGLQSGSRPNAAYAALPFVAGSLRYDLAPLLQAVDRPTLMLWGAQEAQISSDVRRRLSALNPRHIAVGEIAGTRTNFENEAPEATARAILGFLAVPR